jgi:hypothetical protein
MSQNLTPTKNNRRKRSSGGFLKQSFFITDDDRVIDPEEEKKLKAKQESEIKQEPEIKESEKKQEPEIKQEPEKKQKIEINPEIQIETPVKEEIQVEKKKKRMSDRILQLLHFDEEAPVSQTDNSPVEKRKRVKFSVFKKEQSTPTTPSSFIKNDKTPEQLFRETQFRKKEKRIPLMPGDINNQEEATFSGSGILFFNFWVNPF